MIRSILKGLFIADNSEQDLNKIRLDKCNNDLNYCLVDSDLQLIYKSLLAYGLQHDSAISAINRIVTLDKSQLYYLQGEKINFK